MSALASQWAQHCSEERNFDYFCVMYSGIVTLGLELTLVLAQEGRTTGLNTSSMCRRLIKFPSINRGSYMSAHVLLNLLNELGKRDKMRGLHRVGSDSA